MNHEHVLSPYSKRDIAEQAVALWRQKGRPKDQDVAIWLEAEQQLWRESGFTARPEGAHLISPDPAKEMEEAMKESMEELDRLYPADGGASTAL